ncbi:MAG: putative sugar nucleotidyl transferase [Candidatus Omnitrophota bacterium]
MKVLIFEDEKAKQLYPLTYLRPVWELRCGTSTLLEKFKKHFLGNDIYFWSRPELAPLLRRKYEKPVNEIKNLTGKENLLFINGRWLLEPDGFNLPTGEEQRVCGDTILYGYLSAERVQADDDLSSLLKKVALLPEKEVPAKLINYPWDLVKYNSEAIKEEFKSLGKKGIAGRMAPESVIYGSKEEVWVAPGAEIHPMVVLDTHGGPVIIAEGAKVFPFTRIEGPSYIGPDCQIVGGKIREGCSFGPACRVGGEVEESIIQGHSNKYHDGFLGHAYVGEWVNLGALTTNSDLKNDYSAVSVYSGGELMNTGEIKVGSFIGDHTKTSIGTILNTGTVVGIMCNVVGVGYLLPKYLPSFAWFISGKVMKGFGLQSQIETAVTTMSRRKVNLLPEEKDLITYVHEMTKEERLEAVRKSRG